MPFILRHVSLLGIDSSATRAGPRQAIWERVATDLRPADLELLVRSEIGLDEVLPALDDLLAGGARGRYLVRLAG
jgi:acrylyl-CoA reductase (NADPH)